MGGITGRGVQYEAENLNDVDMTEQFSGTLDLEFYNAGGVTIAKGDAVELLATDTTYGYMRGVRQLDVSIGRSDLIAGGALEEILVGQTGQVRVKGVQTGVLCTSGITQGVRLGVHATIDGRLASATATTQLGAIYLLDETGDRATVWWQNQLGL